jgi:hypothetical protein
MENAVDDGFDFDENEQNQQFLHEFSETFTQTNNNEKEKGL